MATPLILSPATVTFPVGTLYQIPVSAKDAITKGFLTTFPAPWAGVSGSPGIQIQVTNNSTGAPIAPILLDKWVSVVDSQTYYYPMAEISTVMPGQTVTEIVDGLPCTQMVLALMYLAAPLADTNAGWTANVAAWAV